VLALKPVNDTELLSISMALPGGFGYILNELHVNIVVDRATDWEGFGHWRLSQSSRANANFDYRYPLLFSLFSQNGISNGVRGTRYGENQLTRTPIVPPSGGSTSSLHFANLNATAAAAGTVDSVISFWEYDLEQLAWYPAHAATNVIAR